MTHTRANQFAVAYGDQNGGGSSASCFLSLGLRNPPVLFCALEGLRGSITSQIAVKMSMDAILENAFEVAAAPRTDLPLASAIIRGAVKEANHQVYQYGHRMGRGGAMGALGAVACFAEDRFSMARLGQYSGYIFRAGKFASLFEAKSDLAAERPGEISRYLGANAQVLVDLASVEVLPEDIFVFSSFNISGSNVEKLQAGLFAPTSFADKAKEIVSLTPAPDKSLSERPRIVCLLQAERPTILLKNIVED